MQSCWHVVLAVVAGCGSVGGGADAAIDAPPMFTVGGMVTGFAGSGLVLRLNGGADLPITADGAFSFPTMLADGAGFNVTIASEPTCPLRLCRLANATGMVAGANPSVTVTCSLPRIRLASHNWGTPNSVRITDDVLALANNATANPRVITGTNPGVGSTRTDSVAFDGPHNQLYAVARNTTPDPALLAFPNAAVVTGDVAPARTIVVTGAGSIEGIEIDEGADRMYVSGSAGRLYIFNAVSTLNGTVAPTATITLTAPGAITLDHKTDRLYIAAQAGSMYVFNAARQLTSASTPAHTVTWTSPADFARSLAIDPCRDRLYLSIRNVTGGVNVFVLNNASTLDGALDLQTAAGAKLTVPDNQVMSSVLDGVGNLYFWRDSATAVQIVNAPHTLSGTVTVTPDKTINAVVASGYGLDVMPY